MTKQNVVKIEPGQKAPEGSFKRLVDGHVETVSASELFDGAKVLVIGVVGAFTPVCDRRHLPEFLPYQSELKDGGMVDRIVCVSAVDPFVLEAWKQSLDGADQIEMLTDTNAAFAETMGLALDLSGLGLGIRSTRYAMVVEDGVIRILNVEKSPEQLDVTSAASMRALLVND